MEWILETRSVPLEVTRALQKIAEEYQYDASQLHKHKLEVLMELKQKGKEYIISYLFPNGLEDEERWIEALICMEIRRYYQTTDLGEEGWTT